MAHIPGRQVFDLSFLSRTYSLFGLSLSQTDFISVLFGGFGDSYHGDIEGLPGCNICLCDYGYVLGSLWLISSTGF